MHSNEVDNLHIISIMHKLLSSQQQTSDLMYGFEESVSIRQELTKNKTEKGTFFVKTRLTKLFRFADLEKVTYGLGYTLTLK